MKEREGIQRDVDTFLLTPTYWSRYMNGIVDITGEIKVLTAQVSKKVRFDKQPLKSYSTLIK